MVPLRTAKTAQLALADYLRALAQVLENLMSQEEASGAHVAVGDTRALDASFNAATATIRPLTRTLVGRLNRRCTRVLRLVDVSHDVGRTVAHDAATLARVGGDLSQVDPIARRAASVARAIAADLDRPTVSRIVRSWPAGIDAHESKPTPPSGGLRSEIEDLECALAQLAGIRGVAIPEIGTGAAPASRPIRSALVVAAEKD